MIKERLFNLNESFFSQSILLLFPILIFSASLEFSLLIGGLAFLLIYLTALTFLWLAPLLKKIWLFPFILTLAILSGLGISSFSFYFYPNQFSSVGYLINLFFVSFLAWQKNLLTDQNTKYTNINKELLPSLFQGLIVLWGSAILREILGKGSLSFFRKTFILIPSYWTLPFLNHTVGAFLFLFLSAILLKLSPQNYPRTSSTPSPSSSSSPSLKTLEQTIAERTSRLEKLLDKKTLLRTDQ